MRLVQIAESATAVALPSSKSRTSVLLTASLVGLRAGAELCSSGHRRRGIRAHRTCSGESLALRRRSTNSDRNGDCSRRSMFRACPRGAGVGHGTDASRQREGAPGDAPRRVNRAAEEAITDSMRMFQWGVEGGRPQKARSASRPSGSTRAMAPSSALPSSHWRFRLTPKTAAKKPRSPASTIIDRDGTPCRIGMVNGNEFSDHKFEKRNYLNLAGSKLRPCSLGPELVFEAEFDNVPGEVRIERAGSALWRKPDRKRRTEHVPQPCQPGASPLQVCGPSPARHVHVHFFGADALSFGDGVALRDGDMAEVSFEGFGRPLRNPIHEDAKSIEAVSAVRVLS